ncbi:MAG: ISKra4 family transposase, partial [Planctomycetota bacterium]
GLKGTSRKAVDKCASYLLKYRSMIRYDECLKEGYPIASGVIEGACRHLIKDRLDITGARWSLDGAEAILRLRSLRASGDFDEYWRFHQRQRLHENHLRNYEGGKLRLAG